MAASEEHAGGRERRRGNPGLFAHEPTPCPSSHVPPLPRRRPRSPQPASRLLHLRTTPTVEMAKTPSKKTAKAAKATSKAAGGKKKSVRRSETVRQARPVGARVHARERAASGSEPGAATATAATAATAAPPLSRARTARPLAPALTVPRTVARSPARHAVLVVHLQGAQAGAPR